MKRLERNKGTCCHWSYKARPEALSRSSLHYSSPSGVVACLRYSTGVFRSAVLVDLPFLRPLRGGLVEMMG